jgi:WD40 repeat protein
MPVKSFALTSLFAIAVAFTTWSQPKNSVAWTTSWSHDDAFIAVGNDNGVLTIYETHGWKIIRRWQYESTTITRVEWNPKYPVLAVAATYHAGQPKIVQLYDISTDRELLTITDSTRGRSVSWNPSGEEVAIGGSRGKVSIYKKHGAFIKSLSFRNPGSLLDIDWHPKNTLLAVEENIFFINIPLDTLLITYDDGTKNKGILTCQWHPSGTFFVTGDYGHENEGGQPSYLKFWDVHGRMTKQIKASRYEYRNIRWSSNGKYLAAATEYLLVFNTAGKLVSKTKFGDNIIWGVSWNSKGDRIVSSDARGNIRITTVKGKLLHSFVHE